MKGKIDKHGNLWVLRGEEQKPQYCYEDRACGDSCPKFGEPYNSHIINDAGVRIDGIALRLCERDLLFFTELGDER